MQRSSQGASHNDADRAGVVGLGAIVVVVAVIATFAFLWITAPTAEAQRNDCDDFEVFTAEDLNAKIRCFNRTAPTEAFGGDVTVVLRADIVAETIAGNAVFVELNQPNTNTFEIVGNGYEIRRGSAAGNTEVPLLSIADGSNTDLQVFDTGFRLDTFDSAAIRNMGSGSQMQLWSVSVQGSGSGTGFIAGPHVGELNMAFASLSGSAVGIESEAADTILGAITVASSGTDIALGPQAGNVEIATSTLTGPVAIQGTPALTQVENSTIVGDGARATASSGTVQFLSSIVATCSDAEVAAGAQGGYVDAGGNVGGCFSPSDISDIVNPGLEDGGCRRPTPSGCAKVLTLPSGSAALGAGNCDESRAFVDQRNQPRTPLGPGCDAGAYEVAEAPCARDIDVATVAELNAAIRCVNANPGIVVYATLLNDLVVNDGTAESRIDDLTQSSSADFQIFGEGHTIRVAPGSTSFPPIISISPGSGVRFLAFETGFVLGANTNAAIENSGTGSSVSLSASSIVGSGASSGIISGPKASSIAVEYSLIDGTAIGLNTVGQGDGVDVTLHKSTIRATQIDILAGAAGASGDVYASTLAGPIGIRGETIEFYVDHGTILGDGADLTGDSIVEFRNSIVASCSSPEIVAGDPGPGFDNAGGNVGGCFGTVDPIDIALADNGCRSATPTGCPQTVALTIGSPALGAGSCFAGETDQRDIPRTPDGPGCDAGAFEAESTFCESATEFGRANFDIATPEELNLAVGCINAGNPNSESASLRLTADITATSTTDNAVFEQITATSYSNITIDGNGFTLRRGPTAGAADLPVLSLDIASNNPGSPRIEVTNLAIVTSPGDTTALSSSGGHDFDATFLAISSNTGAAAGIVVDHTGDVFVRNSYIDGFVEGVRLAGDMVGVVFSTISSIETDVVYPGQPFGTVGLSTLTAPTAIEAQSGVVFVGGSTVLGDIAPTGPGVDAKVRPTSSIVGSCTAPVVDDPTADGPIVYDDGTNVGPCFFTGQIIDTELGFNGCIYETPAGCAPTIALGPNSPARGAGLCSAELGLVVDQRGLPRSPIGAGCDAGAYEDQACEGTTNFIVAEEGSFNVAINCFNQAAADGPTDYIITLTSDITLTNDDVGDPLNADPTQTGFIRVTQPSPQLRLTIDGAGSQINTSRPGDDLFVTTPESAANLVFENIALDHERINNATVLHQGSGELTIRNSALIGDRTGRDTIGIESTNAVVTIANSYITSSYNGILGGTGTLVLDSSTIEADLGIAAQQAASVDISNSTLTSRFHGAIVGFTTQGTITSTTFNGGAVQPAFSTSPVEVTSSFFTGECPQLANLGVGNAGDCFAGDDADVTLPLADNGCAVTTPVGCVPTAAIDELSAAFGAGDCTVAVDQRGEPRTPAGNGCDAGAFEAAESPGLESGDVDSNGTIDNADVEALLAYLAGGDAPPGLTVADVNDDGQTNLLDALELAQAVAG